MIVKEVKDDLDAALELVWNVFSEFEAPEFSQEGVEDFRLFIQPDAILKRIRKGMLLWGGYLDGTLISVLGFTPKPEQLTGHISLLFTDKRYQRMGAARALFAKATDYCLTHGYTKMTVNSSPYAVKIYHKLGFVDANTEQSVNGLRYTPMVLVI